MSKQILQPDDSHPITVTPTAGRVVVTFDDRVIADTRSALTLQESTYPAVQYVPRADADLSALARTDHETYCPYKGDCNYFSIVGGGDRGVNAVWTYESPYAAVAPIEGHLAFYPDRVQIRVEPD